MFNGLANLWKFNRRERDKYHSRDSYFLCRKIFRNEIELPQDLYLSMRKLSNLSPFCNLSHRVFFSVCLFLFWHRNPINFIGAFAGNPRFYHIKTVCNKTLRNPFSANSIYMQGTASWSITSFRDTERTFIVETQNISSVQLDVQGERNRFFEVNITNTKFEKIGFHRQKDKRGAVKIFSAAENLLDPVYISVSCSRTKFFLAIKVLLSVSTFQLRLRTRFRDIKPQHNLFNLKDYFLNLKPEVYLPERSLFSSHSRERRAKFVRLNCYYNNNVRCIKVEATRADRDIQDSRFSYLEVTMHRGSSLSLITHINASLRIAKSFFHKNKEDNRKVSWRLSSLTLLFLLQSE